MTMASDPGFLRRAEQFLTGLVAILDRFDPDELEADLAGGVLRIAFPDKRNCILNRQAAVEQIWLAEGASAWHFVFDGAAERWVDTKGRGDLPTILGEILSRRLGRGVRLDAIS
ncbi:MAG: iron donor protein CyaY [Planctomycetes bacterium]|nr:iron donor protein CyaY [Planctomycetota bacterium]